MARRYGENCSGALHIYHTKGEMLRIKEKKQFLALIESLTENEPEGTLPLTIARSSETPDVLVIHYRERTPDEAMEFVHADGRITQ